MSWGVEYTDEFEEWWNVILPDEQERITATVELLEEHGPSLKRPAVGTIESSRHPNMKELIPTTSIRILFAFDPRRSAVLLLGGDKRGKWDDWYDEHVPLADGLYDEHLETLREEGLIDG